jgi:hypothetical protein
VNLTNFETYCISWLNTKSAKAGPVFSAVSTIFNFKETFMGLFFIEHSWLRHYATSGEVAGSIPDEVTGFFN